MKKWLALVTIHDPPNSSGTPAIVTGCPAWILGLPKVDPSASAKVLATCSATPLAAASAADVAAVSCSMGRSQITRAVELGAVPKLGSLRPGIFGMAGRLGMGIGDSS